MDYQKLKTKLAAGHPITGAYSSSNATAATEMNAVNVTVTVSTVTGSQILNATDTAEFSALSSGDKSAWRELCAIDDIDTASGVAKHMESEIFGAGTTTRSNLQALRKRVTSEGEKEGFGTVREGDISYARRLP